MNIIIARSVSYAKKYLGAKDEKERINKCVYKI
jgi:hypothetical protein